MPPRNRSVRLAVMGSSFQRADSAPYPSRAAQALRRRLVAIVLVVVSLALVTVYFRESDAGALHHAQSIGASALRPFEVGANRVARPFHDLAGWIGGLAHARSENARLRGQVDELRRELIQNEGALQENERLRALLAYRSGATFPRDFGKGVVAAAVLARPASQFDEQVTIAAGARQGVSLHDAVVTNDGLVGQVTRVARDAAQVTLLNDDSSAVSVVDLRTGASGILRHGQGGSDSLVLDRVTKDQVVQRNDPVVTAGWVSGRLASIYPKGIPVGVVTSVGQIDTDLYKQVQVRAFVDFSSLDSVLVLPSGSRAAALP